MTILKYFPIILLAFVLCAAPASAKTFTECYDDLCAMMTISECVAPDTDFEILVEGYINNDRSMNGFSWGLLENAVWDYNAEHYLILSSGTVIASKSLKFGNSFSQTFTLNRAPGTYTFTFVFGSRLRHPYYDVAVEATVDTAASGVDVAFDIKPQSCPNPLNAGRKGVLSAAILGSADFDVTQIDPSTIQVAGVSPIHFAYEDVATPFEPLIGKFSEMDCTDAGPDGYVDLTLKFRAEEIVEALENLLGRTLEDGETVVVNVSADLGGDGAEGCQSAIVGEDVIRILKKK